MTLINYENLSVENLSTTMKSARRIVMVELRRRVLLLNLKRKSCVTVSIWSQGFLILP